MATFDGRTAVTDQVLPSFEAADAVECSEFQALVLESLSDGVVVHDAEGAIRLNNPAAARILGLSTGELAGRRPINPRWRCVHEDGSPWPGETQPAMISLATGEHVTDAVMGVERPDGSKIWLSVSSRPLYRRGELIGAVASFVDMTERIGLMRSLEASRHQFRQWFVASPIAMALVSMNRCYLEVNDEYAILTGWSRDELIAGGPSLVLQPEEQDGRAGMIQTLLSGNRDTYRCERRLRHRSGADMPVMMTATLVRDSDGTPVQVFTQFVDLGEHRARERTLEHAAHHDALTGLPNRRAFDEAMETASRAPVHERRSTALLLVDLDGFKQVNDRFGHQRGDDLLVTVAKALRRRLRARDQVARIGGDEFAVLLNDVDTIGAAEVSAALIHEIADAQVVTEAAPGCRVGASIGIALFAPGTPTDDPFMVFNAADRALYQAKARGGNHSQLA